MHALSLFSPDQHNAEEVSNWLSELARSNAPSGWLPAGADLPVLYHEFYEDLLAESEPEYSEMLRAALGGNPAVTIMTDISGRVPGDTEIREFANLVLGRFCGVATDEHTNHCWTLAEIQAGAEVEGHPFFDYEGWWRERKNRPVAKKGGLPQPLPLTRGATPFSELESCGQTSIADIIPLWILSVRLLHRGDRFSNSTTVWFAAFVCCLIGTYAASGQV